MSGEDRTGSPPSASAIIVGSEPAVVIPAARALARHHYRCIVAVPPGESLPLRSRAIADVIQLDGSSADASALLELIVASEHAALVLPTSDSARTLVSALRPPSEAPGPADVLAVIAEGGTGAVPWSWSDPLPTLQQLANRMLRRLLPAHLVRTVRSTRSLPADRRWRYAARRASRAVSAGGGRAAVDLPATVRSVLFVCHGNRMRSVAAERFLRGALAGTPLAGVEVASAGTHARAGVPADERVQRAALELGVSLDGHMSRPLDHEMVARADMIIVMDDVNATHVEAAFPEAAAKTVLLGDIAPADGDASHEILDPYFASEEEVAATVRRIHDAVARLAHLLLERDAQMQSSEG